MIWVHLPGRLVRHWSLRGCGEELGIRNVLTRLLSGRKFGFDVERAIFLTVLHRLFVSGSDRFCDKWRQDYRIHGVEELSLHHLYRAMTFLGEKTEEQKGATPFPPRCMKDRIEEGIFFERRDLFTGLDLVFFVSLTASVRAEKPGSLPDFSDLMLYSCDSPFNQPIEEDAEVDPKSARYIKTFKKAAPLLINLKQYSSPVYIAGSSTPPLRC